MARGFVVLIGVREILTGLATCLSADWFWWRHRHLVVDLGQVRNHSLLLVKLLLHELVELGHGHVLEGTVLPLGEEPVVHLFKGILLSLLVGQVERVARLLVEGRQGIRTVDEAIFQRVEVHLARSVADEQVRVHLLVTAGAW